MILGPVHFSFQWEKPMEYTGPQLRPHFVLEQTQKYGHGLFLFMGPCQVATESLVDWEDRLANDFIRARSMIHVVGEFFIDDLYQGVLIQRLFMQWVQSCLQLSLEKLAHKSIMAGRVTREGDDLYFHSESGVQHKLSVSIATKSAVSVLIHWGINLDATGAPGHVNALGLTEMGLSVEQARSVVEAAVVGFVEELSSIDRAQCKVMPRV